MNTPKHLIIVAGGTGSRIKNELPKQFIEINGTPIIVHTLRKFLQYNASIHIYIAVHKDYEAHLKLVLHKFLPNQKVEITVGGETRFHSVKNALALVPNTGIVAIHDAARPMVSKDTISRCFKAAQVHGNATPCVPVNDSLRQVKGKYNKSVLRNDYKIIQTPQCFKVELIKKSFEQNYSESFTDDASVFEKAGNTITLTEGNVENIKITYPIDLILAQHLLK